MRSSAARLCVLSIVVVGVLRTASAMYACDDTIYCQGPLLAAVQTLQLFEDSKTFVDMEMTKDRDVVLADYKKLENEGSITKEKLLAFVDDHFTGPGNELQPFVPEDWNEHPAVVDRLSDPRFKDWTLGLNELWKTLGRKMKTKVQDYPDRYSLLYIPNPFIIPGDRFREFYYWDTYWIVKGLLVSGMNHTAKLMIENFLHIVNEYGHIPNGGRIYYIRRSQPPLLTQMVNAYYERTGDLEFVRQNFHLLEREYNFWINNRTISVFKDGTVHQMAVFAADLTEPRPEGFVEDLHIAANLSRAEAEEVYSHIASAAESGWDFSSRWFGYEGPNAYNIFSIKTKKIVPVDLNTFLIWDEKTLATFAQLLGNSEGHDHFTKLAAIRTNSLDALMWNEEQGTWFDYDIETQSQRLKFYPSNVFPLIIHNDSPDAADKATRVINYLDKEGVLLYPGGIPSSRLPTNQQWDFPNAWSPLISLIVNALANNSNIRAQRLAFNISQNWIESNYLAWQKYGQMFEKYDASRAGGRGGGGEYGVQTGFGWTNGVILELLEKYADKLHQPIVRAAGSTATGSLKFSSPLSSSSNVTLIATVVAIVSLLAIIITVAVCFYRSRSGEIVRNDQRWLFRVICRRLYRDLLKLVKGLLSPQSARRKSIIFNLRRRPTMDHIHYV